MDLELIKHYAYELHWHLPERIQKEAIEWLIENTPRDQLALVFPPYAKSCWQKGEGCYDDIPLVLTPFLESKHAYIERVLKRP